MNKPLMISIALLIVSLYSCKDIIEKNLKKENVIIITPVDNYISTTSTITFWWNEVDGAAKYNLQIVKPGFTNITQLVVDTNVSGDKFVYALLPGSYQWRIKAYNTSSSTPYTTYLLSIDSTTDISQETVILISPSNLDTTNSISLTFRWNEMYNADDYRIEIWAPDFDGSCFTVSITDADTFNYTLCEGSFEWGVRGQNISTNTVYSKRKIYIDTTTPNIPTLLSPANNASLGDSTITLLWSRGSVTGSSISDSLLIFSDSLMTVIKRNVFLDACIFSDSLGAGTYFWKVKSLDAAGNKSSYSIIRKFIIQ